ncbi:MULTISPECIES: hypothetical protein [Acidiphilium]|uniref:Esterase PHB depolymerase n=1 Tax=Acidiphilium rubrum TaxID=526 RepID=A0A8G2CIJ5_ACIRU|nr:MULTISPECIES: hypothetical protein [Acidiphilium]SIQ29040.1 hypothetical protein SAMN05421828_10397 [Acidiphilium rubrum]
MQVRRVLIAALALIAARAPIARAANPPLADVALAGGKTLSYFVSRPPNPGQTSALIAIQGYPRDANRTFHAAARAARQAGRLATTLVIAPIFQVPPPEAARFCHFHGVPGPAPTNALWRCGTWLDGAPASNTPITSFGAMNALIDQIHRRYPDVRTITIAGFSAGAQFTQRYAAFAAPPPTPVRERFVIADPSAFLYFNRFRPHPNPTMCPRFNDWKFGTDHLPPDLGRSAVAARTAYIAADIHYLEGANDQGKARNTAYRMLEKNCAAETQGRYRLGRGIAYAAYDRKFLAHGGHSLTIIPGCAHSVTCVFTAKPAAAALFGRP